MTALLVFVVAIAMVPLIAAVAILIGQAVAWLLTFSTVYRESE